MIDINPTLTVSLLLNGNCANVTFCLLRALPNVLSYHSACLSHLLVHSATLLPVLAFVYSATMLSYLYSVSKTSARCLSTDGCPTLLGVWWTFIFYRCSSFVHQASSMSCPPHVDPIHGLLVPCQVSPMPPHTPISHGAPNCAMSRPHYGCSLVELLYLLATHLFTARNLQIQPPSP